VTMVWHAFLAAGLLMWASGARAENGDLDTYLETVRTSHALPALAAAVVKDGEVIASGAVGVRALGTDVPVTIDDRFHIGSDTKAMTATLAGMMVDEGRLRWDSTIGEVLGDKVRGMNPTLAAVTLEQLLSHTSGIPTDTQEIANIYFNVDAFDFNLGDLLRGLGAGPRRLRRRRLLRRHAGAPGSAAAPRRHRGGARRRRRGLQDRPIVALADGLLEAG